MTGYMCNNFRYVTTNFEYDSNDGKYKFKDDTNFKMYCTDGKCDKDTDKINAACLFFFNELFKNSDYFVSVAKSNINIVEYIMIWLSYTLNKTTNGEKNINEFYTKIIENGESYKKEIKGVTGYKNYRNLIDRNYYFLSMDKNIISKLYDALTSLCNMYSNSDEHKLDFTEDANKFVEKYEEAIKDPNITKNRLYIKVLYTLSTDYDNFKKKYDDSSSLPAIKTKIYTQKYGFTSLTSLIINYFFIFLLMFGAITFFIGIYYKYSLFGFRKRSKKQYLRKKLKKIKKEWTINI
ncbi:hypothetical protein YYC_05835 [Plasmodium yoelii 17X]|uniref:PIR protein n=3 Tax=Plasmodium yoelii TaxID=5861 RepID=A0AAE9WW37_PLAYO|nr:PIR protein [Plasmodium yoelii]ETB56407.1 hypothetical protein YYC_05835 [Plasmodium yoelii 17X]WBY59645.1 PIR protein [Plasmodium yoelii yoelii]VTZ80385.1 PIR protein [Plasmodium yoelii]|eukprot:XP_022813449.1 PIR protein [Plasmodium yoelii]